MSIATTLAFDTMLTPRSTWKVIDHMSLDFILRRGIDLFGDNWLNAFLHPLMLLTLILLLTLIAQFFLRIEWFHDLVPQLIVKNVPRIDLRSYGLF